MQRPHAVESQKLTTTRPGGASMLLAKLLVGDVHPLLLNVEGVLTAAIAWHGEEPHAHPHRHEVLTHSHPHYPDIHHRHARSR